MKKTLFLGVLGLLFLTANTSFAQVKPTKTEGTSLSASLKAVSVVINNGRSIATTQDVDLTISALGATQMMISNSSTFAGGTWETYKTEKAWRLSCASGTTCTVYVKFKDSTGKESTVVSSSVTLQ